MKNSSPSMFASIPFLGPMLRYIGDGTNSLREYDMSDHSSMAAEAPRETFMEAAQREMTAFERKEREFRRRAKQERAAELHLPVGKSEPLS